MNVMVRGKWLGVGMVSKNLLECFFCISLYCHINKYKILSTQNINKLHYSCILSIEKLLQSPGKNLSEIDLLIARLDEAGFTIKAEENLRSNFDQQVRMPYISKLIENLKDRFPTMNLISCFSIFTPSELPQTIVNFFIMVRVNWIHS